MNKNSLGCLSFLFSETAFRKLCDSNGNEIIRNVLPAVRDSNWRTVPCELVDEKVLADDEGFEKVLVLRYAKNEIDFDAKCTYKIKKTGQLSFVFEGEANATFYKNRIGWNVLLPLVGLMGCNAKVVHSDGSTSETVFPEDISPHQPVLDIAVLEWTDLNGNHVKMVFDGDVFEMEDHRNWTDASYKIYSTPLSKPFPVLITKGEKVFQKIDIEISQSGTKHARKAHEPKINTDETNMLRDNANTHENNLQQHVSSIRPIKNKLFTDEINFCLPEIGLNASSEKSILENEEAVELAKLNLAFSAKLCDLTAPDWCQSVEDHFDSCSKMGTAAWFSFNVGRGFNGAEKLCKLLKDKKESLKALELFDKTTFVSKGKHIEQLLEVLRAELPGVEMGGGTFAYYAELNRAGGLTGMLGFVSFSISPQVHAFDDLSLVENLYGQYQVVADCKSKYGLPVAINALTFKQRMNFVATGKESTKTDILAKEVDVRQSGTFAALWTLGAIKNLMFAGARWVNLFETVGQRGLMQSKCPKNGFGLFTETPLEKYPVYFLLHELGQIKQGLFSKFHTHNEEVIDGFVFMHGQQKQLWLWNYTDVYQELIALPYCSGMELFNWKTGVWGATQIEISNIEPYGLMRLKLN